MANGAPEQWGAEVIVWLKGGRMLSRRVNQRVGRGGDSPMTREEMWDKSKTVPSVPVHASACRRCSTRCETWKPSWISIF